VQLERKTEACSPHTHRRCRRERADNWRPLSAQRSAAQRQSSPAQCRATPSRTGRSGRGVDCAASFLPASHPLYRVCFVSQRPAWRAALSRRCAVPPKVLHSLCDPVSPQPGEMEA
jgi:hypothetical protein